MTNLRVKINDTETSIREGVSSKGKPYKIRTQDNVFIEINEEIRRLPLNLDENVSPYAAGVYSFDPASVLRVGRYGLEVDNFKSLHLVSVASAGIPQK